MDSKLTLKLNREVIEKAKQYAPNKKLSLSRLVEAYFNHLHLMVVKKILRFHLL